MSDATRLPDVERGSADPSAGLGHDELAAQFCKALGMVEAMARTALELIPAPIIASVDGDDETTEAEVDVTEADAPTGDLADCPCNRRWSLDRAHHDWLLSFEQRGVSGAVEVMDYFGTDADENEREELTLLSWVDFLDFVAVHNWQDPEAVQSLASMVDHAIRWQKSAARASSRLKAIAALSEGEQDGDQ